MRQNPTKTVKEKLLVSASAQQQCWCSGSGAAPSILGTQWGSAAGLGTPVAAVASQLQRSLHRILITQRDAGSSQPAAPARVPAGHNPGSQYWICDTKSAWEGPEGPSVRLREGPGTEILKSSQDDSLIIASRSACPALKALFGLPLWLKESSIRTAAGNDGGQTPWMAGSAGISQGCVTAPSIPEPLLGGPPSPNTLRDFLPQAGSVQGAAVKAGVKPASRPGSGHRACAAQPGSRGRAGAQPHPCAPCPGCAGNPWHLFSHCKLPQGTWRPSARLRGASTAGTRACHQAAA